MWYYNNATILFPFTLYHHSAACVFHSQTKAYFGFMFHIQYRRHRRRLVEVKKYQKIHIVNVSASMNKHIQ